LERQIVVARNALSLLMGEFPAENLERGMMNINLNLPERLPAGIPTDLLTRRPDLRASEQRLKAAMANVGLTYADRFHSFGMGLTGGL
ncbi:MAG: TolC family protein, partial [Muribaculaceae bacterium]|nr:TolC family protein [Muribaculaceae bacterium]